MTKEFFDGTGILTSSRSCYTSPEDYQIPTKLSELENDMNFIRDAQYQHTDNNFTDEYKEILDQNADLSQVVEEAKDAADRANAAASVSETLNDNPPKIVNDYWWLYSSDTGKYENTGVKAIGDSFVIKRTYPSVKEMEDNFNSSDVSIGEFVVINTNDIEDPENSRLYMKAEESWKFITDLSGATGITGLSAYQIAAQQGFEGTEEEWVNSLSADSKEAAKLANAAAESATKATSDLRKFEEEVKQAEGTRQSNETIRIQQEADREQDTSQIIREATNVKNETDKVRQDTLTAKSEAIAATQAAELAVSKTNQAILDAQAAAALANTKANLADAKATLASEKATLADNAATAANTATGGANTAATNANQAATVANTQANRAKEFADNPPKIEGGTWWVWDEDSDIYVNTGINATGPKGDTGNGLNIIGELTEESQLPANGESGDAYLISGQLYVYVGSGGNVTTNPKWSNVGNIKGEKGDAATIQVGTVTSGDTASINNSGTSSDAVFDFVLPKGDAATIQVGTVTSGENASVSNSGNEHTAIFDFVLPSGEPGKSPKIQGGTWWVWSWDENDYVNTNISVSSDYELTKEKVENVLTGDINSHNHDSKYIGDAPNDSRYYGRQQGSWQILDDLFLKTETDPTVPSWAKQPSKPTYTAEEVGALPVDTEIPDISGLATKQELEEKADASSLDGKVDKVTGKSLISDSEITRLASVTNYNDTEIKSDISDLQTNKVDKVEGKGLSTNDFTNDLKTKLEGLQQTDWNATSGGAQILNKPEVYTKTEVDDLIDGVTIPGVYKYKGSKPTYSDLPATGNEVGDVWNVVKTDINYAWTGTDWDPLGGTSSMANATEAGLMSSENFTKLQGIEASAQVNKVEAITFAGEPIEISSKSVNIPEEVHTSDGIKPSVKVPIWVDLSEEESKVSESYTKQEADELFQGKVPGKGLSTNDFTNSLKSKLDGIEEGAQVNVKPDWSASAGNAAEILNKPTIPTKTSDLTNDSGFTTKTYVDGEIAKVHQFEVKKVDSLPGTGESNVLYLVPKSGSGQDVYNEYIWDGSKFELIGNTSIDLSDYYTKEEVNAKIPVITVSANEPSGGKDGDIWFQIVTQ